MINCPHCHSTLELKTGRNYQIRWCPKLPHYESVAAISGTLKDSDYFADQFGDVEPSVYYDCIAYADDEVDKFRQKFNGLPTQLPESWYKGQEQLKADIDSKPEDALKTASAYKERVHNFLAKLATKLESVNVRSNQ